MNLDDRKIKILEAIINDYIKSGEPIGSKIIADKHNLGVSSATIRNEMSELKELGLIEQPYSSSGRIPSDKGYRIYVNSILKQVSNNVSEINLLEELINNKIVKMDLLMKETAKAISNLTNYATFITKPKSDNMEIKQISLLYIDSSMILITIVNKNIYISNKMIKLDYPVAEKLVKLLDLDIDKVFKGKSINTVKKEELLFIKEKYIEDLPLVIAIIEGIISIIKKNDIVEYYTSGINNVLSYPEFKDIEKVKKIFKDFEENELVKRLLDENSNDEIQIVIGSENSLKQMEELTLIKSKYTINENSFGSIGIIGPTRMDYLQAISTIDNVVKNISRVVNENNKSNGGF